MIRIQKISDTWWTVNETTGHKLDPHENKQQAQKSADTLNATGRY